MLPRFCRLAKSPAARPEPADEPRVAVVGASRDRRKYGNKAVRAYAAEGWAVYPIHPTEPTIEDLRAFRSVAEVPVRLTRITLYLPPDKGLLVLPEIAAARPAEFYVNPGAESAELLHAARELGLEPIVACSILAIGRQPD